MANETKRPEDATSKEENSQATAASQSKSAWYNSKITQYWLAFLLVSTLVLHGIGLAYYKSGTNKAPTEYSPEIAVGNYQFTTDKPIGARITAVEFSLYFTALDGLDNVARNRMISRKYRVQQELESLMRQVHSGDFEDPNLNDLKRQIRDRINQALGNRVVSDVIVANLKISAANNIQNASVAADTSSSPPWVEKSPNLTNRQDGK
jgi:flagellar basal body-associated protein FliL